MDLKKPLTIEEQIKKLEEHGITIKNHDEARALLERVSYYRLSGYTLQFRKSPSSSMLASKHELSEIRRIYDFDSQLRAILRYYIEILEIYYKTVISNSFSLEKCNKPPYDQHYLEDNYFDKKGFDKIIENFNKEKNYYSDSLIVKHHRSIYDGKMPLWVMFELMSFSNVSMLYNAMYTSSQENIAKMVGIGCNTLANHLHCMSVLRNKCAHAARLINTRYNPPAKLSKKFLRDNPSVSNDSLFAYLKVIKYRLPSEELRIEFQNKIFRAIDDYKDVLDLSLTGFPENYINLL